MAFYLSWGLQTTQFTPLQLSILASFLIHVLVLWQFSFTLVETIKPITISLAEAPFSEVETSSTPDRPTRERTAPAMPSRKLAAPVSGNTARRATESASSNPRESAASSIGIEGAVTDPGGIDVGGSPQGWVGSVPGTGTASGTGSGSGSGGPSPGPGAKTSSPPVADPSVIAIPPTIRGSRTSFEGEVYAEVGRYVLHGPDLRVGIAVPGNELCVDGNILRTIQRSSFTKTITDFSKCTFRSLGDESGEVNVCPPDAHTRSIVFDGYLASPVNYSINACLVYDKSNCYEKQDDDGSREVCRPGVKYEGIWAAGTRFEYRCAKAETQTFSHPLQYTVRFVQDVEWPGDRIRQRLLGRETRQIPQCK